MRSSVGSSKICSGGPSSHTTPSARKQTLERDLTGEAHLVGGQQHRHALRRRARARCSSTSDDELGVERARDLVEQQHPRLHRQRPDDGDALLLAAREPVRVLVALVGQPDARRGASSRPLPRTPCVTRAPCAGPRVMLSQHRHVGEEVEALEHDADVLAQPVEVDAAAADPLAVDARSRRRRSVSSPLMQRSSVDFPQPDGADEAHDLVLGRRSGSMPRSTSLSPKCLCDVVDLEEGAHRADARMRRWSRFTR